MANCPTENEENIHFN